MRIVVILALAAIGAAPAPRPAAAPAAKPVCQNTRMSNTVQRGESPRVHPLTADPPAALILGVLRTVDGCTQPVVIREDVGAPRR